MGDLHHASADDLLTLMGRHVAAGTPLSGCLEAALAEATAAADPGPASRGVAAADEAASRLRLAADLLDIPHPADSLTGEDAEDVLALASLSPRVLRRLKAAIGEPKSAVFND